MTDNNLYVDNDHRFGCEFHNQVPLLKHVLQGPENRKKFARTN